MVWWSVVVRREHVPPPDGKSSEFEVRTNDQYAFLLIFMPCRNYEGDIT